MEINRKRYCINCTNYVLNRQSKPTFVDIALDCCISRDVWVEETAIRPGHFETKEEMNITGIKNKNHDCRDFTSPKPIMKGMQTKGNRCEMGNAEEGTPLPPFGEA